MRALLLRIPIASDKRPHPPPRCLSCHVKSQSPLTSTLRHHTRRKANKESQQQAEKALASQSQIW